MPTVLRHRPALLNHSIAAALAATALLPLFAFSPVSTAGSDPAEPRRLTEADLKALSWRSIGPANMSGRVADIALAPGNAKTFFIGFATGGLFKTTNAGTTLRPVFDKYETSSIGSIVVADAPADWAGWADEVADADDTKPRAERGRAKIVWVGTGEGNGRNSSSWGHGVYRSTDGGDSFEYHGLAETHDIPRLAVDPRDPDICYVAALGHLWGANEDRGVYKTSDGGKTWQKVLYIDENTGACDVLIDPEQPDTIYAAMYQRRRTAYSFQSGGEQGGVFRSDDGGANWTQLTNGLPPQTGRIGLDLCRDQPNIIYTVIESDDGGQSPDPWSNYSTSGGVFRSDDRGATWQRMSDFNPRAFYFSKVRVDPHNDQRLFVLGWEHSHYTGKGVKLGTPNRPILWYKPTGAENYRVIYADLSVKEMTPEEVKELPRSGGRIARRRGLATLRRKPMHTRQFRDSWDRSLQKRSLTPLSPHDYGSRSSHFFGSREVCKMAYTVTV